MRVVALAGALPQLSALMVATMPRHLNMQGLRLETMKELEPFAEDMISKHLLDPEEAWQPSDFLPDPRSEGFLEEVAEMREIAKGIPDDVLCVLVGDMITEEALPTYTTLLNSFEGADDPTGASPAPWAKWSRQWTSEENRHGDCLNTYLYLTGRVDMRAIEKTIMRLLGSGFNPKSQGDPYRGFIYTSFQERATKISHGNVGKLAKQAGDSRLTRICAQIAGDEARHEKAYQAFVTEMIDMDRNGVLTTYAAMMKDTIVMPAESMTDGSNPNLFSDFSKVANDLGVYTAEHYSDVIRYLNRLWQIEDMGELSSEAAEAQDFVMRLPDRFDKLAARAAKKTQGLARAPQQWSWLSNRMV